MKKTIVIASPDVAMSEKVIKVYKAVENETLNIYRKIEKCSVEAYKRVERCAVNGYRKIEDAFVDRFLDRDLTSRNSSAKQNNIK